MLLRNGYLASRSTTLSGSKAQFNNGVALQHVPKTISGRRSHRSVTPLATKEADGTSDSAATVSRRNACLLGMAPCCACGCTSEPSWYNKYFAYAMANLSEMYEVKLVERKQQLFSSFSPDNGAMNVLEIGFGTGPNLKYYAKEGMTVTGLDPNSAMQPYAEQAAQACGFPAEQLKLLQGRAEQLPVDDQSMDVVISTLVLCSVGDVPAALQEVRRVLRPGGRFIFLEHVLAPPDRTLQRLGQQLLTPLQRVLADGCHLNRDTLATVQAAGFNEVDAQRFDVDGFQVLGPHVAGTAVA